MRLIPLAIAFLATGCGGDTSGERANIVINELVASNQNGLQEQGTRPDWVELYNEGKQDVDLTGYFLTDDLEEPRKWEFPNGVSITGGGYLVVFCDSDPEEGKLHTSFDLSITGEAVGLFAPDSEQNREVDAVEFGPIASDYAWARMPDEEDIVIVWPPTPGQENRLDPQPPGGAP